MPRYENEDGNHSVHRLTERGHWRQCSTGEWRLRWPRRGLAGSESYTNVRWLLCTYAQGRGGCEVGFPRRAAAGGIGDRRRQCFGEEDTAVRVPCAVPCLGPPLGPACKREMEADGDSPRKREFGRLGGHGQDVCPFIGMLRWQSEWAWSGDRRAAIEDTAWSANGGCGAQLRQPSSGERGRQPQRA
jgi:hypothetical protein